MKKLSILIVDEDTTHMPHFKQRLERLGFRVRQITDWRTLSEPDDSLRPDVIVLDLMMPKYHLSTEDTLAGFATGIAVYKDIIAERFPDTPFFIFTAALLADTEIEASLQLIGKRKTYMRVITKDAQDEMIDELRRLALQ